MGIRITKLPPGYAIGMRVRTNDRYAACYAKSPKYRLGTIVGGSHGQEGAIIVKLDDHKKHRAIDTRLFDVIEEEK